MSLSPKERHFVAEYLIDQKGGPSAIRAGYSKRSADQIASRLLRKDKVREAIEAGLKKLEEKSLLTAEYTRNKIYELLSFDPRKAFDPNGGILNPANMPQEVVVALTGVDLDDTMRSVQRIKFTDRIRAAELAAKVLGMMRFEISGKDGAPLNTPTIDFSRMTDDMLRAIAGMRVSGKQT